MVSIVTHTQSGFSPKLCNCASCTDVLMSFINWCTTREWEDANYRSGERYQCPAPSTRWGHQQLTSITIEIGWIGVKDCHVDQHNVLAKVEFLIQITWRAAELVIFAPARSMVNDWTVILMLRCPSWNCSKVRWYYSASWTSNVCYWRRC